MVYPDALVEFTLTATVTDTPVVIVALALPLTVTLKPFSISAANAVGTIVRTIAIASRSDSNLLFKDFIKFLPFSCQRGPAPRGILLPVRPTIPDHCEGPVSKLYLFCNDS